AQVHNGGKYAPRNVPVLEAVGILGLKRKNNTTLFVF
ncbi:unnamed protein product, partial [Rotaria sp. Silwood2]